MIHIQITNIDTICLLSELINMNFFDQLNVISIGIVKSDSLNLPVDLELSESQRDQIMDFKARLDLIMALPGMTKVVPDEVFTQVYKMDKNFVVGKFEESIELIRDFAQDLEIQLSISKP